MKLVFYKSAKVKYAFGMLILEKSRPDRLWLYRLSAVIAAAEVFSIDLSFLVRVMILINSGYAI